MSKTGDKIFLPVLGCLMIQLSVGILYIWSVFRNDIIHSFNFSASSATMVAPVMLMCFVIGCLFGGIILDRIGPRTTSFVGVILFSLGVGLTGLLSTGSINLIFLTYCAMGGIGCGFAYMSAIYSVQRWLPHKRGLASGLAVSAFGLSTVVFAPIIKMLIGAFKDSATEVVDFNSVFFILAGILIVLGLAGCMLSRDPSDKYLAGIPTQTNTKVHATSKNFKPGEVVKLPYFWCMWLFTFCFTGTYNLVSPLIVPLGEARDLTPALAVLAVSVSGITNTGARLICAALSDKIGRVAVLIIFSIVMLVAALSMTFVTGFLYIVVVAVIAFCYGTPASVQAAMITDVFGTKYAGTNYGIILLSLGGSGVVFNLISTELLGGDPKKTFIMATISAVLAIAFIIPVGIQQKRAKVQRESKTVK